MNYASVTDFRERFASDSEVEYLMDETGDDRIAEILNGVEAEVDSYLARRYSTPITLDASSSLDDVLENKLKSVTLDIAVYRVMGRQDEGSEIKKYLHDLALAWLKDIAKGNADLPDDPAGKTTVLTQLWDSADRVFTRDTMGGW